MKRGKCGQIYMNKKRRYIKKAGENSIIVNNFINKEGILCQ